MLMIIYPNKKINLFLEREKNNKLLILDKICHLKNVKDKNNDLLIDCKYLKDNGIIKEYNYSIEEVFISINVNNVICINENDKIKEICNFYKINLISI